MPAETQAKVISGLSQNIRGQNTSGEFEQRAKIAELALKEEAVISKGYTGEKIVVYLNELVRS